MASSLLGELLYERGDLDEAERLLDEGYRLGPEGGLMDFKIARYVTGARVKALRGDRDGAIRRLNEAARIAWALSLPRLHAVVENERIRLGLPVHPEFGALPVTSYAARRRPVDVIDLMTVQHEEATAIRTLLLEKDPAQTDLARRWAQEWVDHLTAQYRPQALLQARLLFVACLVRRRTHRRGEGHARDHRGTVRAVGTGALPARRRAPCGRHHRATARGSAGRTMEFGMARSTR